MFIRSLAGASHILTYRYSATLAHSLSITPPSYLRNQCLNSLVNFSSLSLGSGIFLPDRVFLIFQ